MEPSSGTAANASDSRRVSAGRGIMEKPANAKNELLATVKEFERRGMAKAMLATKDHKHIISSLRKRLSGKDLEIEIMFKEVNGVPKFATFTFLRPKVASFIFFSYDDQGKRFVNRKLFNRMYEFLESSQLVPEFRELIMSEQFDEDLSSK
ncbi:MAG: hypothetical protein R6W92_15635 [Desulfocurvibacter africanus]